MLLSAVLTALVLAILPNLQSFGIQPEVARATEPYLRALTWSMLPLLLYATLRRYLQALGQVRAVMFALVSANVINAIGQLGARVRPLRLPGARRRGVRLGDLCIARVYMFLFLLAYAIWHEHRSGAGLALPWRFELRRLHGDRPPRPAVGAADRARGGRVHRRHGTGRPPQRRQLAAHQVALSAAAFTFMVPLGISSAAAVRVGQAMGRLDRRARRAPVGRHCCSAARS